MHFSWAVDPAPFFGERSPDSCVAVVSNASTSLASLLPCGTPSLTLTEMAKEHSLLLWLTCLNMSWQCAQVAKKTNNTVTSWLVSEMGCLAGIGRWSCPCIWLWWGRTSSTVFRFGPLTARRTLSCWSVSKEEQQSWRREQGPLRSSWGNWGCLVWRKGGSLQL